MGDGKTGSVIFVNMYVSRVYPIPDYIVLGKGKFTAIVSSPAENLPFHSDIDTKFKLKLVPLDISENEISSLKSPEYVRFYAHTLETLAAQYSKHENRSKNIPVFLKGISAVDDLFSFFSAEIEEGYFPIVHFLKKTKDFKSERPVFKVELAKNYAA